MQSTYCTNIHQVDGWPEVFDAIRASVPPIRAKVAPDTVFPLCLWLSWRSLQQMGARGADEFRGWCQDNHVQVTCLNGFPFGAFHDEVVKQQAYLPDWRSVERLDYTCKLAALLAKWLPAAGLAGTSSRSCECWQERVAGVISTVPIAFGNLTGDMTAAYTNITKALQHLDAIAQKTQKRIVLAFEPEPGCALETTDHALQFAAQLELPESLKPYFGICYDCCHQTVEFEDGCDSLGRLQSAGINVPVVHVSSALRAAGGELATLRSFAEPKYLHQTVAQTIDGELIRFADLGDALARGADGSHIREWRVHFHVPVDAKEVRGCATTKSELVSVLKCISDGVVVPEAVVVETYSLGVLMGQPSEQAITQDVCRQLLWLDGQLQQARKDQ